MSLYYLDIETTDLCPEKSRIITIQYQELDYETGMPFGDVTILCEWESSEKDILERFIMQTPICAENRFHFCPLGYNLFFEDRFLRYKTRHHNLNVIELLKHPHIDLHGTGIMMNCGKFKNSGLDKLTNKPSSGDLVPKLYAAKDYAGITSYVRDEAKSFIEWYTWLLDELPLLRKAWNSYRLERASRTDG